VLTRLDCITHRAETQPEAVFNNLFSLLNFELLGLAFRRLKRGKVPGRHSAVCQELTLHSRDRAVARNDAANAVPESMASRWKLTNRI